jgi:anti-anti-sigma factor
MKLTLLPLQNDEVIRLRCDGMVSVRGLNGQDDPLQALLGPHCYCHKVLLNLERAEGIDTTGLSWLMRTHERFNQAHGTLVLFGIPPTVGDILDFLRLTPLLRVASAEAAALDLAGDDKTARPEDPAFGKLRLPG